MVVGMRARIETPLKRVMDSEGRSYSWLARQVGVSRGTVQHWINGVFHPTDANRAEIARVLGRSVDELWPADEFGEAA